MRTIFFTTLALFTLSACGSDTSSDTTSKDEEKATKVSGDTVAEITKNGPNITTRQAKDAWFVHRITSISERKRFASTECQIKGEFENKGDVPLYIAQVKYRTKLVENAPEGTADDQEVIAQVAPEFGKPNLDPFLPGEIRAVNMGALYFPCAVFEKLTLTAFIALAINADGTAKYRSVKDGAPALIIDNQTDFTFARDQG